MKKFLFSLERMLKFKITIYEKERSVLAKLRAERLLLEQKRDNTNTQMLAKDAEFRDKAAHGGVPVSQVSQINFHRENSHKMIEHLNADMALMDIEIEKQLEVVMQLDKDVKGLEKLKEKQLEEYNSEAIKEERERISEIVSGKFIEAKAEEIRIERKVNY